MQELGAIDYMAVYGRGEALWVIKLHKLYLSKGFNTFSSFVKSAYPDLAGIERILKNLINIIITEL